MSPCQKDWTSQIVNGDKVAINSKNRPSPFQFSKCLQRWGAEAPRRAVSLLPLITFATNEAARQGTGAAQPSTRKTGMLLRGFPCLPLRL